MVESQWRSRCVGHSGGFGGLFWLQLLERPENAKLDAASDLYNQLVQVAAKPSPRRRRKRQSLGLARELKTDYAGTTLRPIWRTFCGALCGGKRRV